MLLAHPLFSNFVWLVSPVLRHYVTDVAWCVAKTECHSNNGEHKYYDRSVDGADDFHAWKPGLVVQPHRLHSTPNSVVEVKPKRAQPYEVKNGVNVTADAVPANTVEGIHNVVDAICGKIGIGTSC